MRLWRIAAHVPGEYPATDITGEGARRHGARWNSVGVPAVYAAYTVSTAVLESLAHLGGRKPPRSRYLVALEVPNRLFNHPQHGVKRYAPNAVGGQSDLRLAQADGGTGIRDHQVGDGY
jgi:RES domain-containing protein